MEAKYFPSIKKADFNDVASEIEILTDAEILEHGLGTNSKYYVLIRIEANIEGTDLEIIQYDLKDVPEETVEEFSSKLEDIKRS